MTVEVLPPPRRSRAPLWLVLLAASHLSLGIEEGLLDGGDYGLLYLAIPFVVLTLVAASLLALRRTWAHTAAIVLTAIAGSLALYSVPLYLVGAFHLPQAVVALVITARFKP